MIIEIISNNIKELEIISLATFSFFSPNLIAHKAPPPTPTRYPQAAIIVRIGPHTPTPARAKEPASCKCPI